MQRRNATLQTGERGSRLLYDVVEAARHWSCAVHSGDADGAPVLLPPHWARSRMPRLCVCFQDFRLTPWRLLLPRFALCPTIVDCSPIGSSPFFGILTPMFRPSMCRSFSSHRRVRVCAVFFMLCNMLPLFVVYSGSLPHGSSLPSPSLAAELQLPRPGLRIRVGVYGRVFGSCFVVVVCVLGGGGGCIDDTRETSGPAVLRRMQRSALPP